MCYGRTRSGIAAGCAAILAALGCGHSPYEIAPVRGTVTIDGKPVSAAKVMFAPLEVGGNANPGKPAFGLLQADGAYTLTTYKESDGAVVGDHWVTIISLGGKKKGRATLVSNSPRSNRQFSRLTVPNKVTVDADKENQIDIKLTAQDVARFGIKLHD